MQPKKEQKVKIYGKVFMAPASAIYYQDQKKMAKKGWRVVSCTEMDGGKRLNVIYEKD